MKNGKVVSLAVVGLLSTTALVGCNKGNDEALAKEILSKISIGDAYMQPNGDFSVPNKILHEDQTYEIVWTEVEDSPYVSIEAVEGEDFNNIKITIPAAGEADADYAIKATVKVGDKSASQEFEGTIIADALINKVYTDASEFYDDIKAEKIDPFYDAASFEGIVSRKYYFNYYLTDAEGDSVVVNHKNDKIKVGDKVKVKGKYTSYYTMNQFKSDNISETVVSSGNTVPELRYYADNKTKAYNATELLAVPHEKGSLIHGQRVKVTGIVEDDGQGITLRDPTNLDEKIIMTKDGFDKSKPEEKKAVLDATKGKIATFDAIYYCHHDKVGEGIQPYVLYDDAREASKIPAATELTGETLANYNVFNYTLPGIVSSNLETTYSYMDGEVKNEFTLKYTADKVNDKLYIQEDGKVILPEKSTKIPNVKVEFISKADETKVYTKNFKDITVGIPELTPMSSILSENNPDKVYYIEGTIYSLNRGNGYIVGSDNKVYRIRGEKLTDPEDKALFKVGNYIVAKVQFEKKYQNRPEIRTKDVLLGEKAAGEKNFIPNWAGSTEIKVEDLNNITSEIGKDGADLTNEAVQKLIKLNGELVQIDLTTKDGTLDEGQHYNHILQGYTNCGTNGTGVNMNNNPFFAMDKDLGKASKETVGQEADVTVYASVKGYKVDDKSHKVTQVELEVVRVAKRAVKE